MVNVEQDTEQHYQRKQNTVAFTRDLRDSRMERTHCIHTSHNEIHKIPICRGFCSRDSEYYGNWNSVQKYLAKNTRKPAVCNT